MRRVLFAVVVMLMSHADELAAQQAAIRINSGGPAVTAIEDWAADTYFADGKVVTYPATLAIANTDRAALYRSNRYGMSKYTIPTANGPYELRLHFAETYFAAAGLRVFNVAAEGQPLLSNFDIWKEAGGKDRALVKTFAVNVADGALDLVFTPSVNSAQVDAIELLPQATGSLTFTASSVLTDAGLVPTLTWTTTPAANRCEATTGWTGAKAATGSETLPSVRTSTTYGLACYWGERTAKLSWKPPTLNDDGSALINLGGYRILYGRAADQLTQTVGVPDPQATAYTVGDLATGTWFFALRSFNTTGQESANSATVTKTLSEGRFERSLQVTLTPNPNPATEVTIE